MDPHHIGRNFITVENEIQAFLEYAVILVQHERIVIKGKSLFFQTVGFAEIAGAAKGFFTHHIQGGFITGTQQVGQQYLLAVFEAEHRVTLPAERMCSTSVAVFAEQQGDQLAGTEDNADATFQLPAGVRIGRLLIFLDEVGGEFVQGQGLRAVSSSSGLSTSCCRIKAFRAVARSGLASELHFRVAELDGGTQAVDLHAGSAATGLSCSAAVVGVVSAAVGSTAS
ncbi:MAG: hypothetical protein R3E89_12625 [Thiolinea sp.]